MKTLTIERLSHDLRGVAHADGITWFVEGSLPGETVEAGELLRRQQLIDAEAVRVVAASPERIEPACSYYRQCGGCSLQHVDHAAQIRFKQQVLLDQLARIGKVTPQIVASPLLSPAWNYRRRARLACKWSSADKRLAFGLRARHSQQIVEIEHCDVLVPALQSLLQPLREYLSRWSQPRQLGHVELLAADNGVGLLLRVMAEPSAVDASLLQAFSASTGVTVFLQQEEKQEPRFFCGTQAALQIVHTGTGSAMGCLPGDFVQGNAVVNTALVGAVIDALEPVAGDTVLEAFCGLGNFTLPLALRVQRVVALELSETMLTRAATQAAAQGLTNIDWRAVNLDQFDARQLAAPSASRILLDPPRDGAQVFCRSVDVSAVTRIVYVSCNPSTLARDAAILAERGLALRTVQLVDMFPQTSHIEALAVFEPDASLLKQVTKKNRAAVGAPLKKLRR